MGLICPLGRFVPGMFCPMGRFVLEVLSQEVLYVHRFPSTGFTAS